MPKIAAVVVAAGRGVRAGGTLPKQFQPLGGRMLLCRTIEALASHPAVDRVLTVISAGSEALYRECLGQVDGAHHGKLLPSVPGGATRQQSVLAGLEALAAEAPDVVLIHDAARPFIDGALIARAIAAAIRHGAAVPGVALSDTVKIVDPEGRVESTPTRSALRAVQTPQAFAYPPILDAYRAAAGQGLDAFTDDGALAEWAGLATYVFEGDPRNRKITGAGDLAEAERALGGDAMTYVTRVGTGFDVHAYTAGDHVWLGGVKLPADRGVLAHSDGDVVLHALTDALLGAISDGDIGVHFPPSDPRWRGASSDQFLADAATRVRSRGGLIDHLDITVLAEQPRIGPHRDAIRRRIAEVAGVPVSAVSIKATTTETLGFVGRGEGLAAQASATIRLP